MLEPLVVNEVDRTSGMKFEKTGLILDPKYPTFGASPDGINQHYVLEVKCLSSSRTKEHYITETGTIGQKYYAQLQLQMFLAKKTAGFLCVASPDFEKTKHIDLVRVELDVCRKNHVTLPSFLGSPCISKVDSSHVC